MLQDFIEFSHEDFQAPSLLPANHVTAVLLYSNGCIPKKPHVIENHVSKTIVSMEKGD